MEKEQKDLIGDIVKAFKKYAGNQALVINDRAYTYEQLSAKVHQIVVLDVVGSSPTSHPK